MSQTTTTHVPIVQKGLSMGTLAEFVKSKGKQGFTVADLVNDGFSSSKDGAKMMIKRARQAKMIDTVGRHKPQRYYDIDIIADVEQELYSQKVPIQGIPITKSTHSNIIDLSIADEILSHNLESEVLPYIRQENAGIHRLHFHVSLKVVDDDVYPLLAGYSKATGKGAKVYELPICGYKVEFHFNPNNTVMVYTESSRNPLPLTSQQDKDEIIAWMGEIRQSLKSILYSQRSDIVPPISEWGITGVDLTVDPEAPSTLHFSSIKVKVKHLNHVFQSYVKSLGNKTAMRLEIEENPNKPAIEWLEERFTMEGMQRRLTTVEDQLVDMSDRLAEEKASRAKLEAQVAQLIAANKGGVAQA